MNRFTMTAAAVLALVTPALAAQSPVSGHNSAAQTTKHAHGFASTIHIPTGAVATVSSAECNRRSVGVSFAQHAMSVNGATDSQTVVAMPIGGGSVSAATTQAQISDVCGR